MLTALVKHSSITLFVSNWNVTIYETYCLIATCMLLSLCVCLKKKSFKTYRKFFECFVKVSYLIITHWKLNNELWENNKLYLIFFFCGQNVNFGNLEKKKKIRILEAFRLENIIWINIHISMNMNNSWKISFSPENREYSNSWWK